MCLSLNVYLYLAVIWFPKLICIINKQERVMVMYVLVLPALFLDRVFFSPVLKLYVLYCIVLY